MDKCQHWQQVFSNKEPVEMSWTQAEEDHSLKALQALNLSSNSHIVEAGCGVSRLSDQLVSAGFTRITLVDISQQALVKQKKRHNEQQLSNANIQYLCIDLANKANQSNLTADCWIDRAVFHFLTDIEQQRNYLNRLLDVLPKKGYWILATFSEHGPEKCSGLPVLRYSHQALITFVEQHFPDQFISVKKWQQQHLTPWGAEQSFNWWILQRI
ncbi:class I SAM-dependent methyltransferase [Thalassotalea sp. PS06]|uniref:class I SAM-dependent methyltransferase n=1 Tax=Thalassotalea sp. PS06 TaxID=2594005 RepID=UPI001162C183|nr:class I SAM-dependent methyltransferase [Thalassotalea sp. PS06]QDP01335.1 class I SAM-dependent methyltransferase [Thalassotalea sp. PS06]